MSDTKGRADPRKHSRGPTGKIGPILLTTCAMAALPLAGGALAADLVEPLPVVVPPPPPTWTGLYAGVQIGYAFGATDFVLTEPGGFLREAPLDPSGIIGGGHVGYLHQFGGLVVGLEGDVEGSGLSDDVVVTGAFDLSARVRTTVQGSVRGRLGYAFDRFLPYATGGLALARTQYEAGDRFGPCCGFQETNVGWTAGAGLEVLLTDAIRAGVEYRYTDLGTASAEVRVTDLDNQLTRYDVDLRDHAVRARVSVVLRELFD